VPNLSLLLAALEHYGMLLKQDTRLPSVVGLILGEPLRGSWWGHPRAHEIFALLSELADHPDVLFTKLLSGKDTLVHRRLWPELMTVGSARAAWQLYELPFHVRGLLDRVQGSSAPVTASGMAAKELQYRLLVVGREVHTSAGRHALALESWAAWSRRAGCSVVRPELPARATLEAAAARLGARATALPWNNR
jgi:hypothetical protein